MAVVAQGETALPVHRFAKLFPALEGKAQRLLAADIAQHGLREKIVLLDGAILDGRNRYQALLAAKMIAPIPSRTSLALYFRNLISEDGDPLEFVLSHNLHRRHLKESQRAYIAAQVLEASGVTRGGRRKKSGSVLTIDSVAASFRVSPRSIFSARVILRSASPVLRDRVAAGSVSILAATRALELPQAQISDLAAPPSEVLAASGSAPRGIRLRTLDGATFSGSAQAGNFTFACNRAGPCRLGEVEAARLARWLHSTVAKAGA